jgi:hypothetical protein
MLTAIKKALILAQAGSAVPAFPGLEAPVSLRPPREGAPTSMQQRESDAEQARAVERWSQEIEALFVTYTVARAARSLREAEQARQIDMLRRANARPRKSP